MSNVVLRSSKFYLSRFSVVVLVLYSISSCYYHADHSISIQQDAFVERAFEALRSTGSVEGIPLAKEWQPQKLAEIDLKYFSCESHLNRKDDFFGMWYYQIPYKNNTCLEISIVHENPVCSLFLMTPPKFSLYDVELLEMGATPNLNPD